MKKAILFCLVLVAVFFAGSKITSLIYTGVPNSNRAETGTAFQHLPPLQFNSRLGSGKYILVDIRTAEEYAAGHLKNAKQSDYYQTSQFSEYLDVLNKNDNYLIYCRSGKRSELALKIMQDKGFKHVSDLAGGYNAWIADNYTIEK